MGEEKVDGIQIEKLPPPNLPPQVPPHSGDTIKFQMALDKILYLFAAGVAVGSRDDSLQNCLALAPKQPKKDLKKMLDNAGKSLRFSAKLHSAIPSDQFRQFVVSYYLEDDSIAIFEQPKANSGIRYKN